MPPPANCGARIEPWRARPVPFWRHGLAEPPRTMPRVLVAAVPCRRAFSSARTHSWTRPSVQRASQALASSSTVPPPIFGALGIRAHLHRGALRARHRAAQHDQVVAGADLDDREALLRHALVTHLARQAHALEHARWRGRGADRARRAHVVGAVRLRAGVEVVALDAALEALALRDPRDLHLVARGEHVGRD